MEKHYQSRFELKCDSRPYEYHLKSEECKAFWKQFKPLAINVLKKQKTYYKAATKIFLTGNFLLFLKKKFHPAGFQYHKKNQNHAVGHNSEKNNKK